MDISKEELISIIKMVYKEGYLDADGDRVKVDHWWEASSAKSIAEHKGRSRACIKEEH